jgi:hypothetical protein
VLAPARLLGVQLYVASAAPLGRDPVPLAELPQLGGGGPMPGFLQGRFRGATALAAALVYRWPLYAWVVGELRWDCGNAFGPGFAGLAPGAFFGSASLAVHTTASLPVRLDLLVGAGTSRFDAPSFGIDHVRWTAGLSRVF